jgi:hypothetical protein
MASLFRMRAKWVAANIVDELDVRPDRPLTACEGKVKCEFVASLLEADFLTRRFSSKGQVIFDRLQNADKSAAGLRPKTTETVDLSPPIFRGGRKRNSAEVHTAYQDGSFDLLSSDEEESQGDMDDSAFCSEDDSEEDSLDGDELNASCVLEQVESFAVSSSEEEDDDSQASCIMDWSKKPSPKINALLKA